MTVLTAQQLFTQLVDACTLATSPWHAQHRNAQLTVTWDQAVLARAVLDEHGIRPADEKLESCTVILTGGTVTMTTRMPARVGLTLLANIVATVDDLVPGGIDPLLAGGVLPMDIVGVHEHAALYWAPEDTPKSPGTLLNCVESTSRLHRFASTPMPMSPAAEVLATLMVDALGERPRPDRYRWWDGATAMTWLASLPGVLRGAAALGDQPRIAASPRSAHRQTAGWDR